MSLFIITRMREGTFEFPDEFSLRNNQPYFSCPDQLVWVFEGSIIFEEFMMQTEDGTLDTNYEGLCPYLEKLVSDFAPHTPLNEIYMLIHDGHTVAKMKERKNLPWLEKYETPRHLDGGDGATKYKNISEIIARTANQESSPEILRSILCTYFYEPFLGTAVSTFAQHFGGRSLENIDFHRDILKLTAPFPALLQKPVADLQQLFSDFLPHYQSTPFFQTPPNFSELKSKLAAFQPPCNT
ncbi:MAG: hypothetical protein IT260_06480 [Saprospiraceae bacterium]|nr:hypothetical protein [Saprospiraceae bacterium]